MSRLDDELEAFLEWQAEERAKGVTLASLHQSMLDLTAIVLRVLDDGSRYQRRVKDLEFEVERISRGAPGPDWRVNAGDTTGVHQLTDLQEVKAKLAEEERQRRDSGIWWRRQRWQWVATIAIALLMAGITGCIGWLAARR